MTNKKNVWVVPQGDDWAIKREGADRASKVVERKSDAEAYAKDLAKKDHVELIVQRSDGTIQKKNSYGNDPNPPKDTQH